MDSRKILKRVAEKEVKTRFTVSIDPQVLESLKNYCGDRSLSAVIEELIREFNEDASRSLPDTNKKSK